MSAIQNVNEKWVEPTGSAKPAWLLVFFRELSELWIWGKALVLIILFSVLLGIMSFVLSANSELSLIPPKEMVFLMLQAAIAVGLFIGLIIGADSISGERERGTLEALLLTPTSRRQLVLGKFLAAISPWPVAMVITIPYLVVLSQGDEVLSQALFWGAILGTLLTPAFTGFGILVSMKSNSNKASLFVSLTVFLLCLLPTQFPGSAQTGAMGKLLKRINPMESVNHFLEKTLVNNRTLEEVGSFLLAPILFSVLVFVLLFFLAGPGLRLEAGMAGRLRSRLGRIMGMLMIPVLLVSLGASALKAQDEDQAEEDRPVSMESPLQISIDMSHQVMKTGDKIEFHTTVTYNGTDEESSPMIVAMNIINLDGEGDPVDPEDWSPERAQYIEPLSPGQSAKQNWTIHTILEGDFMAYMVLIPEPDSPEATSRPVASSGIHLTVHPFTRLNPGGVLPFAVVIPIVLLVGLVFLVRMRRKKIDNGDS